MCARMMLLVFVSPVTVNAKSNVPPVMAPLLSRVGCSVIVAVPVAPVSPPPTAVVSCAAVIFAVNTSGAFDGAAGLSSSQATAPNTHAAARTSAPHRFIVPPVIEGAVCPAVISESPGQVELEIDVGALVAERRLPVSSAEAVGQVDLEQVTARLLLEREAPDAAPGR